MKKIALTIFLYSFSLSVIHSQTFLLKPTDFDDDFWGYMENFQEVTWSGPYVVNKELTARYGENLKMETAYGQEYGDITVYSVYNETRFPLVRSTLRLEDEKATVYITKMRVPPRLDIKKALYENGFVFVNTTTSGNMTVTVFTGQGSTNPLVVLIYSLMPIQVLEIPNQGTYLQSSMYVEDRE